ncbi:hypothetical protein LXA43DRAFT_332458 [Ganoderma leucocontextum]|nr:hypothetical protein LXA43DRAFT_332458 [Ganoderma leucocontextum]
MIVTVCRRSAHIVSPCPSSATMEMSFAIPSQPAALYTPVEVCEHIIDMLYSGIDVYEDLEHAAALRSCSLVCRSWRIRAQRMLFYSVHLGDVASLYKFAAVLQAGLHLGNYVHEVALSGRYIHTTASMLSPFLAIFQVGKLPNLHRLAVLPVLDSTTWYPQTPNRLNAKALPYIPLHSHFPLFLSAFTTLSSLQFEETMFRSFGEFARMVYSLPNLETLVCNSVRWKTLGRAFTEQTDGRPRTCPPFALKLRNIIFWNSGSRTAEWLMSACGPHLTSLNIGIPLGDTPEEPASGVAIDLGSFPELGKLTIMPSRVEFSTNQQCGDLLKAMLASWKPQLSEPKLVFGAYDWSCRFTRQEFARILEVFGTITESWRADIAGISGNSTGVKYKFFVIMHDRKGRREPWVARLCAAFPTWLRLGGLIARISESLGRNYEWKSDEQSSKSNTTPQLQLEAGSSGASSKNAKCTKPPRTHHATSPSLGHATVHLPTPASAASPRTLRSDQIAPSSTALPLTS